MQYFLGIDIGTFASRGMLIDENFAVCADASVPHGMDNPRPGWFEQDAETVWWGDFASFADCFWKKAAFVRSRLPVWVPAPWAQTVCP